MKHSIPKRFLSIILTVMMMITIIQTVPELTLMNNGSITAEAASAGGVQTKINTIKTVFPPGSFFTVNGKKNNSDANDNCHLSNIIKKNSKMNGLGVKWSTKQFNDGYSCFAFATFVYGYTFGKNWKSNSTVKKITSVKNSNLDDLFSNCRVGDLIKIKYNGKGGYTGYHFAIFMGYTPGKELKVYDCNTKGNCQVYSRSFSYKWLSSVCSYMERYRAKNYDQVNKDCPVLSVNSTPNTSNTSVRIAPSLSKTWAVQRWDYFISTDKNAVNNINPSSDSAHKSTGSVDCIRAYDYGASPKNQKSVNIDISKYKGDQLKANTTYYYKAACKVGGQWYSSALGKFTTSNAKPGKPYLRLSKGSDIIGIGDQAGILWDAAENAQSYDITVMNEADVIVQSKTGITGTSYALDAMAESGTYTVLITAVNSAGRTVGNSVDFTVMPNVTVSFYDSITSDGSEGREIIDVVQGKYGQDITPPKSPSHEGHIFSKWSVNLENVKEDAEAYAVYDRMSYKVRFIDSVTNAVIDTATVKYKEAAAAPNVTAPEGYVFTSWDKDFSQVTSDMDIYTVYKWADEDHCATISIDKARKNTTEQGYDISVTVSNRTEEIISGRVVAVLLSENGTILTKADSSAFAIDKAVNGAPENKEINFTVLYPNLASRIEVYVVNSYDGLGKLSVTAKDVVDNSTLTDWTELITYTDDSELPAESDSIEVESGLNPVEKTYYRYQVKDSAESYNTSLSGYIQNGYSTVKDSSGTIDYVASWPSGFNTSNAHYTRLKKTPVKASETANKIVKIDSSSTVGYLYWHWCRNAKLGTPANRTIEYRKTSSCNHFHAFQNSKNVTAMSPAKDAYKYSDANMCQDSYWWGKIPVTRQTYTTYNKLYNYYKLSSYSEWIELKPGETLPNDGDSLGTNKTYSGVETKTVVEKQYRYRARSTSNIVPVEPSVSEDRIFDLSGTLDPEMAGKDGTLWVYKYDQASDYTTEFVSDIKINDDGTVSVPQAAILEAPTIESGDYTIAVSVDGQTKAVEIGKIAAPKPEYKVTFLDFDGETVISQQTVTEGQNAQLPGSDELTVPEGYRFTNWSESVVNVKADLTVKPECEAQVYTAAFVNWEAQTVELKKFSYGDALVADSKPESKDGYTTEWVVQNGETQQTIEEFNEAGNKVTSDMIVVTRSSPNKYTITFLDVDMTKTLDSEIESAGTIQIENFGIAAEEVVENGDNLSFEEVQENIEESQDIIFLGWINAETGEEIGNTEIYESAIIYPSYVFAETASEVSADIETGEYDAAQTVALTSETENSVIWFTTDGSDPKTSSTAQEYTAPVEISRSCTLRAYAGAMGCNDSGETSFIYVINDGNTAYHILTVEPVFEENDDYGIGQSVFLVKHGSKFLGYAAAEIDGYVFDSLYFDAELKEQFHEDEELIGETTTLYANYIPNTFKVTFLDPYDKVISEQNVTYKNNAQLPEAPELEGKIFVKWDREPEHITEDTVIRAVYIDAEEYAEITLNRTKDIYITADGGYNKLAANITPAELGGYDVVWTSSNEEAATVDENGKITAVGVGDTVITAEIPATGSKASVTVHVTGLSLKSNAAAGFDSSRNLRGLKPETTAAQVKEQFVNEDLSVVDMEGNILADDAIAGTGCKVCLLDEKGDAIDSAVVIITGDYTGDGKVNNKDSAKLNAYVANIGTITANDTQMTAMDVNGDGKVNNRDCAMLGRYLVGKEEI